MPGDFQVDADALKAFSKAIRENVLGTKGAKGLAVDKRISGNVDKAAKVDFGQDPTVPGLVCADDLFNAYSDAYSDHVDNHNALHHALEVLAGAADLLAKQYEAARDADAVSAKAVDDAINNAQLKGS